MGDKNIKKEKKKPKAKKKVTTTSTIERIPPVFRIHNLLYNRLWLFFW